jgi:hypothetical protein
VKRGEHAAADGSFGRSAGGAMARGIVLIVLAVGLGIILLNATDGPEPFRTTSGTGNTDTTEAPATGNAGGDTTDTTQPEAPAVRPPSEVTVLVANGSGVRGAAASLADTIRANGYVVAEPANAPAPVPSSIVYYLPGYEQEAQALASLLNPAPPVAPMPDPQPVPDLRGAHILVMQGPDLAASG